MGEGLVIAISTGNPFPICVRKYGEICTRILCLSDLLTEGKLIQ